MLQRVRAAAAALTLLFSLAGALLPVGSARAQEPERDQVLDGSGIRYPLGYDRETEGVVEGRLERIEVPERGPVRLHLIAGGRRVTILTSPPWYWERADPRPAVGETVRVLGSKTLGADGELYVVAREITPVDSRCGCLLRDESGRPLWRGRRHAAPGRRCATQEPDASPPAR